MSTIRSPSIILCRLIHTIVQLNALPSTGFSYSPLIVPLGNGQSVTLARRDLFDARFQLIAQDVPVEKDGDDTSDAASSIPDLEFLEAPSDLVPGVYEGGLKTWECSLDLVTCVHNILRTTSLVGTSVLELGCGTAIPSLYLLHRLFDAPPSPSTRQIIHLQDYNGLVFRLVTLPNIIITWYMSPASSTFRASFAESATTPSESDPDADGDPETLPPVDPSEPGELPMTPQLISAFKSSLQEYGIDLSFFAGSWQTFNLNALGRDKYDIILTSETIYRPESLPSLVELMRKVCLGPEDESLARLSESKLSLDSSKSGIDPGYTCLVAAKLVYFGVGGGVAEFIRAVEDDGKGKVEIIWEKKEGVKRSVMRVIWK
ncbi:hypothetical protein K474DRAFT_1625223 [Panus rudis PR-1116 ss-1]|nr:hypothetical protein K474DRAFT_1625223 [Panus rudis PR-1116 ss-1]